MPSKRWYLEERDQGSLYVIVDGLQMDRNGKAVRCLRTITEASTEPRASAYKDQALIVLADCMYLSIYMHVSTPLMHTIIDISTRTHIGKVSS